MRELLEKLGDHFLYGLEQAGRMGAFVFASLASLFKPPFQFYPIIRQIHFIGARPGKSGDC